MIIILPWLNPKLSPNARAHWSDKARHIKKARHEAYLLTLEQMKGWQRDVAKGASIVPVKVTFHPPDNRRRDLDNMIASMKAAQDGVAQALGVDDNMFQPTYALGDIIKGGKVVMEVVL